MGATDARSDARPPDIVWGAVCAGACAAVAATALAGAGALYFAQNGMWWIAVWGTGFVFAAAAWAGFRAREPEPLNGAFIAVLYCAALIVLYFAGEGLAVLPDPLPGLPRGDSTFFFVWPLALLAAATMGAMLGGRRWRRRPPGRGRRDEHAA